MLRSPQAGRTGLGAHAHRKRPVGLAAAATLAFLVAALPSMASSIEVITTPPAHTPNITMLRCEGVCPPLLPALRASSYRVPELAPGTDRTEIREINGQMKAVRDEAWLGGSPVTFVSKATDTQIRLARGELALPAPTDLSIAATAVAGGPAVATAHAGMDLSIDRALTTAALSAVSQASVASPPAQPVASQEFDGQTLELRLH